MKRGRQKLSKKFLIVSLIISIILLAGFVYAINTIETGYKVIAGTEQPIIIFGQTYYIKNNLGLGLFVPTKTGAEWNAFQAAKPSGVTSCIPFNGVCSGWSSCSLSCGDVSTKCGSWTLSGGTQTCTVCNPPPSCHGGGCSPRSCSITCQGTDQCISGMEICTANTCHVIIQCYKDSDCGAGRYCSGGRCYSY